MTRSYEERHFDMNSREWNVDAVWSFATYAGDNEHFTVTRNGETKTVLVENDYSFTVGLRKTKILASGGAHGLFEFIDNALFEDFNTAWAWKTLKHAFFVCKAA